MIFVLTEFIFFSLGNLAVWCTVFNQIHATRCPRSARKGSELLTLLNLIVLWLAGLYLLLVYPNWIHPARLLELVGTIPISYSLPVPKTAADWSMYVLVAYFHFCAAGSWYFIIRWIVWRIQRRDPKFYVECQSEFYDFEDEDPELLQGLPAQLIHAILPGSQLLVLSVESKLFRFPNLPPAFDGYRISQLSDLHFTGRIGKAYFQNVIDRCLQWEPNLICITGDLIDKSHCLDWIEEVLGRLKAPDGVFYILGNHDRRIKNESLLRSRLARVGLIDANGKYLAIPRVQDGTTANLWLAGNEIPWYAGAEKLEPTASQRSHGQDDFFIALSHSPDQWPWAERMGFDLMLAGHTHGGQVNLPVIGPIIAPSRFGVKYASGVFQVGRLALQVSRGISGAEPLRWNCPPELTQITLERE